MTIANEGVCRSLFYFSFPFGFLSFFLSALLFIPSFHPSFFPFFCMFFLLFILTFFFRFTHFFSFFYYIYRSFLSFAPPLRLELQRCLKSSNLARHHGTVCCKAITLNCDCVTRQATQPRATEEHVIICLTNLQQRLLPSFMLFFLEATCLSILNVSSTSHTFSEKTTRITYIIFLLCSPRQFRTPHFTLMSAV